MYNHSISVDVKIMVSKNSQIIGEHVAVKFVAQFKNEFGDPYFLLSNYRKHDKMQIFAKFKKHL